MSGKHRVITLCGSTKFKEDFETAAKWLTLSGNIVLMPNVWIHSDNWCDKYFSATTKRELYDLHLRKIDMSDSIYVINQGNYVGDSTKNEIKYALEHGKQVEFMYDYTIKTKEGKPCIELYMSDTLKERCEKK